MRRVILWQSICCVAIAMLTIIATQRDCYSAGQKQVGNPKNITTKEQNYSKFCDENDVALFVGQALYAHSKLMQDANKANPKFRELISAPPFPEIELRSIDKTAIAGNNECQVNMTVNLHTLVKITQVDSRQECDHSVRSSLPLEPYSGTSDHNFWAMTYRRRMMDCSGGDGLFMTYQKPEYGNFSKQATATCILGPTGVVSCDHVVLQE